MVIIWKVEVLEIKGQKNQVEEGMIAITYDLHKNFLVLKVICLKGVIDRH